jgi:YVTN family beta-propeller protein
VQVGILPIGVAVTPDGAHVYVTNQSSNTVSVIATASNTVVAEVRVAPGPTGVAVAPDFASAYVTNQFVSTVSVMRPPTTPWWIPFRWGSLPGE